jgi:hypothetical protein
MYVTASLQIDKYLLHGTDIIWGELYHVAHKHVSICGPRLEVIAGPHADFDMYNKPVFTVRLTDPPEKCDLPFFNKKMHSAFENVLISIERPCF